MKANRKITSKPAGKENQKTIPPVPENEAERLALLHSLNILDTQPEQAFDDIVTLAASICKTPVALVTLVDENRQWFKANIGLNLGETPREISFCAHAILKPDDVTIVTDVQKDPRFKTNPLVTGDPNIRFYAGAPLVTHDGLSLGTLCVIDRKPRRLTPDQLAALRALRHSVITEFELRRALIERKELQAIAGRHKHLRDLIESALDRVRDGFVAFDPQMNYTYVNERGGELLERNPEDLIGKNYWEEFPEAKGTPFADAYVRALKTQKAIVFEDYYKPFDRWFENRVHPSSDGLSIFFTDITERKRAEAIIKRERDFSNVLLDSLPGVFYLYDDKLRFLRWNKNFEKVTGYTGEEIAQMSPLDFFTGPEKELISKRIGRVFTEGIADAEANFVAKDGTLTQYYFTGLRTQMDDKTCLVGVGIDITERKQAENELRASEARLRTVLETSPIPITLNSLEDGIVLYGNSALSDLLGVPLSEIVGQRAANYYADPADRSKALAELEWRGSLRDYEVHLRRPDGKTIWISLSTAKTNFDGRPCVLSCFVDITVRRQAEEALRESEQRYRSIFQTSGVSIWEEDFSQIKTALDELRSQGVTDFRAYFVEHPGFVHEAMQMLKVVDVNEMTLQMYGAKDKAEFLGSLDKIFELENFNTFKEELIALAEGKTYFEGEVRDRTLHGSYLYLWRTIVFPKEATGFKSVLVCLTDITKRKQAEEALRQSEERFRALIENSWDAIALFGVDGSILYGSPSTPQVLGYSLDEFVGQNALNLIHAEDHAFVTERLSMSLRRPGEHISVYARVRHKNGEWRWLEGVFTNLLDNPSVRAIINNYHDFTERKQAESLQEALYQISEAANKAERPDELYQSVHAIIGQVMPARNFYIALSDDESDLISFPYYVDEADRFESASIPAARPGRGMTEYVIRTGKPLLSDAANFEELARRGEVELVGPPSPIWLGAPLIVEGRTIGAMAMQDYANPNVYTERELRILEYVSGQVAKAIERTRLYEDIQMRNRILSALQEATLPLISQRELSEVLQAITMQASQLLNSSHSYIYLVEPDEKAIHVALGTGVFSGNIGFKLQQGEGVAGKVWQTAQPLNVQDYHTWAGRPAHFDNTEFHAVVGVPLISGSRVLGVLGLAYLEPERTFNDDDVELLSRFAQLASIALDNARLHTQVRQELAERRTVQGALLEAEAKYRSLVERLPVVIYTSELGATGTWHYISPQIESLLGFTPEEWMADPNLWYRQVHPDDRERQDALEERAYARGEPFEGEYRIFTRAGSEIWIRDSAQILPPREGELPIVQGVLVDITERKRAKEALQESEETTRLIIDTALDAVITIDQDALITRWNDQAEAIFGWTRTEAVGQRLSKLIIPSDLRARHEQGLKHYLETGEGPVLDKRIEITAQRRNGDIFPVELTIHVLKTNSKVSFAAFVRDITERKQAEENLRTAEAKYRSLVEHISAITYTALLDDVKTRVYVSPQIESLLGYTQEQYLNDADLWKKMLHPDDQERVLIEAERFYETGEPFVSDYRSVARDGRVLWFHDEAVIFEDETIQQRFIQGIKIDITDRKRAEENLRAAEARYRSLVEQLPGIVYTNPASDLSSTVYVSPQVKTFLGYSQAEWLEDPKFWRKLLHPEDRSRVLTEVERVNQSGEMLDLEYRMVARDSLIVWFRDQAVLLRDANGNLLLRQGLMMDITERKRTEDKIKRHLDHLKALRMIDMTITASADLHLSLQTILRQAVSQLQVDAADILLLNTTTHLLEYSDGVGFLTRGVERSSVRIGEGLAGQAVLERKMLRIHALYESRESLNRKILLDGENFTDYYGVPLIAKGEVKGVLEVFRRAHIESDQEWEDFLEALAGQAGLAIDNATLFQNLQRSNLELGMAYESTLEGWSAALDLRDKETEGHTLRVTNLTLRLAKHMGLNDKDLMQIRRGALLHDIGKMGVPDRILLKPDNLTAEEWAIMQRHPVYAHELLSRIEYLRPALSIPYCHHEKWNGTGYPRGLKGEEIPLDARVFSVVDVYDALVSDRPYRPAWTKEKALEYIRSLSGVDFDPRVVTGFLELLAQY